MAHLKPTEILARAQEFLQGADLAMKNDWWNVCTICSYAALFWATRAALAYEGLDQPMWNYSELRSKFNEDRYIVIEFYNKTITIRRAETNPTEKSKTQVDKN